MYRIYSLVLRAGLTVLSPYFLVHSRRYWPTLPDRFGYLKLPRLRKTVWVHAVSVGEVKAVEKLLERLRQEFPDRPVVVSTTTVTGQSLAREQRGRLVDHTLYFPLDLPGPLRRTLDRLRPSLVIIAETEIWPNFLRICRQRNIPVMMVNGRISDKSLSGYRRVRRWLGRVLNDYTVLGMQSDLDRRRMEAIGADVNKITVFGNLKYDVAAVHGRLDPTLTTLLKQCPQLWIAASTMPGEDEMVLDAFRELKPSHPLLKLMIAPRHPDRSNMITELIRSRGLDYVRRQMLDHDADVLLLDTIGELAPCFEFASVVFMGGSLVPRGGHNVLEPARYSKPVIVGPHTENFRDIVRLFLDAKALIQISSATELAGTVRRLLEDSALASTLGENALRVVSENIGATDRVIDFIRERISTEVHRT
jgi:3-deoxy-D-manno-octulosonic-acid transferase